MNTNQKISLAAEAAIAQLAALVDAIDLDYTDDAHKLDPGQHERSRVILGGVRNAKEHFTNEFLLLLEDARYALDKYKKAVEEYKPEPRRNNGRCQNV